MNQRDRFLATLEMTVIQSFLNLSALLLQHFIIPTHPYNPSRTRTATTHHPPASLQLVISAHIPRHPRAGGNPVAEAHPVLLDPRLRGDDEKKIGDGNDGEKSGCLNRWRFPVAAGR